MQRPVVHFIAIGAIAFALTSARSASPPLPPPPLAVDDAADGSDAELLYRAGIALALDRDDVVVQSRLLRNMRFLDRDENDAASAYRDALHLDIGRSDVVVRRRVIERMQARLRAAGLADEPSDADLRVYLDTHRADFRVPPRAAFVHVFFSRQRRGARVEEDALTVLARLQHGNAASPTTTADPLPILLPAGAVSEREVTRLLGSDLAARLFALEVGRWSSPIASPYGLHLFRVDERVDAIDPSFESLRAQLRAAVRNLRAEAALRDGLAALRADYSRPGAAMRTH